MKHSILKDTIACLLAASLSLAGQEAPTQKQFMACAWCGDLTIGARAADVKGEESRGYELWMHMPEIRVHLHPGPPASRPVRQCRVFPHEN